MGMEDSVLFGSSDGRKEEKVGQMSQKCPKRPLTHKSPSGKLTCSDADLPHYVKLILLKDVRGRERSYCVPASLDLDRPKRARTTFSPEQIQVLEMEFGSRHFLSLGRRQTLALLLGLSETQVKVWFQNRRTKVRKLGGGEKRKEDERNLLSHAPRSEIEKGGAGKVSSVPGIPGIVPAQILQNLNQLNHFYQATPFLPYY